MGRNRWGLSGWERTERRCGTACGGDSCVGWGQHLGFRPEILEGVRVAFRQRPGRAGRRDGQSIERTGRRASRLQNSPCNFERRRRRRRSAERSGPAVRERCRLGNGLVAHPALGPAAAHRRHAAWHAPAGFRFGSLLYGRVAGRVEAILRPAPPPAVWLATRTANAKPGNGWLNSLAVGPRPARAAATFSRSPFHLPVPLARGTR